ncbi:telomere maintenance [Spatholobus suberectus]|nr:telomere maintenance [Spatholobus suberectus]
MIYDGNRPSPLPSPSHRPRLCPLPFHAPAASLDRPSCPPCPIVLVEILTLPTPSPPCSCLCFFDALCCDLLHFCPTASNKEIYVTAWNLVPFKRHSCNVAHSLLEITDWRFPDPNNESKELLIAMGCIIGICLFSYVLSVLSLLLSDNCT